MFYVKKSHIFVELFYVVSNIELNSNSRISLGRYNGVFYDSRLSLYYFGSIYVYGDVLWLVCCIVSTKVLYK